MRVATSSVRHEGGQGRISGSGADCCRKVGNCDSNAARTLTPKSGERISSGLRLLKCTARRRHFFARQLHEGAEGKVAKAYLDDRGLDREAMIRFGLGFAPSSGDGLLRYLKSKYHEKVLDVSGLFSAGSGRKALRTASAPGMFPMPKTVEDDRVCGRAMGDDMPKYMNSPETSVTQEQCPVSSRSCQEALPADDLPFLSKATWRRLP